jgi:O-antigen ligase
MKQFLLLDNPAKTFTVKEKILYFGLAAFFITLFLPDMPVINNIVIGGILVYSFFYNTLMEKRQLFRQRKEIGFMILFYLLHIISAFFSENKQEAMTMLVLRLPLLVFPLALGLLYISPALKNRILLYYSAITTLAALVCLLYALGQYAKFHDAGYLYDDSLSKAIRRQSIYFALMVGLALFSYVYLLLNSAFTIRYRALVYISILFLLVIHFMLASRVGIITLYSSLLVFAVFTIVKKGKWQQGTGLLIGLPICVFLLLKFFPKTINRFHELAYTHYNYNSHAVESHYNMQLTPEQWNGANIRLAVWKCGWEVFRHNWFTGAQLGDKQDRLMEVYKARQFDFAYQSKRNMHNTYLDIACCFGVIGLLVFLLGWIILPLLACFRGVDRPGNGSIPDALGVFIIVAFAAAFITETYLDTSIGCILTGFFICLVSAWKRPSY